MKRIGVVGAGKWGEALAFSLSFKNDVLITSRRVRNVANFVSVEQILDLEYIVIAMSAQHIGSWLEDNFIFKNQKILVASKGIEASSGRFLDEVFAPYVPDDNLAFLSGPSFATEVMSSLPTAVVVSSRSDLCAQEFSDAFAPFMRVYTDRDIAGVEVCGAYKNVIAIASGVCSGLRLGNNAAAALISRGLVEMRRFGKMYGAEDETFLGLSGAGDLFLTASSTMSRNFRAGLALALGKSLVEIEQELGEVAEGIATTYALHKISQEREIYLPIATEVYEILEGRSAQQSLERLLRG